MTHPSPSPHERAARRLVQAPGDDSPADRPSEARQDAQESQESPERAVTLLEQMGGLGGLVASVVPVLVFVVVNTITGLQPALWSAVGAAAAVAVWRLVRREPLQPAVSGVVGVGLCAFIAYRTGEARGFFLYGIWFSLVAGVAFLVSVAVRRPLVGVIWSVLNGTEMAWRADRRARFGYDVATVVWAVFFLARFAVQQWLYTAQQTAWLGVARLLMGLPLTAVAALVTIWAVRRAMRLGQDSGDSGLEQAA